MDLPEIVTVEGHTQESLYTKKELQLVTPELDVST